jgi:Holliday junction DNA helicase RuvA
MIAVLHGKVLDKSERALILDVHGVGYEMNILSSLAVRIQFDQELTLFTFLAIRENAHELFGFEHKAEKEMFLLLLTVPGVGPRSAMNILDGLRPSEIASAIQQNKPEFLVIKGLGLKTAEKIIQALKEKIRIFPVSSDVISIDVDFVAALETLGYNSSQIREVVLKLPSSAKSTEEKVREALQLLAN